MTCAWGRPSAAVYWRKLSVWASTRAPGAAIESVMTQRIRLPNDRIADRSPVRTWFELRAMSSCIRLGGGSSETREGAREDAFIWYRSVFQKLKRQLRPVPAVVRHITNLRACTGRTGIDREQKP